MTRDDPSFDTIFSGAIEIASEEERAAFVARACGTDEELRRRVERLVDAHFQAGSFLESPPASPTSSMASASLDRVVRHGHRPVQAPPGDRRGGHGHGLHGRADPARAPHGRPEAHQGRHGQPPGARPVRGRTPGPGADGPPQHRQGLRRRHHRHGPSLLRHGAGQGHPDHPVLRRTPADDPRAARAGHPGLPGRAARPPEGDHPPRPQAVQRPDRAVRRQAGARR